MSIDALKIERNGIDMSHANEIRPGDTFKGSVVRMRKKTVQKGRPMKTGEKWDDSNAWGDPFCVHCIDEGDYFLLWNPGREKEWFINDKHNFKANYHLLDRFDDGSFTCIKHAEVVAFIVDRPMMIHGKEQNRDPARARVKDVVGLDADGHPYRIPKSHYRLHYDILEAPQDFLD